MKLRPRKLVFGSRLISHTHLPINISISVTINKKEYLSTLGNISFEVLQLVFLTTIVTNVSHDIKS